MLRRIHRMIIAPALLGIMILAMASGIVVPRVLASGVFASGPDATYSKIAVRGTDNAIHFGQYFANNSTLWTNLGGTFASDPALTHWESDDGYAIRYDVFGRGTDDQLYTRHFSFS